MDINDRIRFGSEYDISKSLDPGPNPILNPYRVPYYSTNDFKNVFSTFENGTGYLLF
jgi:hypothetical protein